MKVKQKTPIVDAYYYDGTYAFYLDIFNAIKALSRHSTLTTWEEGESIYYFNPFLNQKVRFSEGDYVVVKRSAWNHGDILVNAVPKESFEEEYEIISRAD